MACVSVAVSCGDEPQSTAMYSVTVIDIGNGTAEATVGGVPVTEAEANAEVTITAAPAGGYDFVKWTVLSGGVELPNKAANPSTFIMPASNVSVAAEFAPIPPTEYDITVKEPRNGTVAVTVNGIPVTKATGGTTISIVATPAAGYEFATWALTGTAPVDATALSSMLIMPAGNASVAAEFRQEAHTGVVINGVRWATCNVDAPGTFAATTRDAGMFYQWGRNVGWSNANPLASAPEGRTWDTSTFSGTEWPSADDPCP